MNRSKRIVERRIDALRGRNFGCGMRATPPRGFITPFAKVAMGCSWGQQRSDVQLRLVVCEWIVAAC